MNTQITNINTENGYIYFHCNAHPFCLGADNKDTLFSLVTKNEPAAIYEEGEKDFDYDYFDYDLISDFPQYIEDYILELKDDWIATELDAIDEGLFEGGIITVTKTKNDYQFFVKHRDSIVRVEIWNEVNMINIHQCECIFTPKHSEIVDIEESTKVFFDNINTSESYISVIAYELLINVTKEFKDKSSLMLTF